MTIEKAATLSFDCSLKKLARSLENPLSTGHLGSMEPTENHNACIMTILRVLDNILQDPNRTNPKVRKIKVNNPAFWKRAGKWDGCIDFLLACGFIPLGETFSPSNTIASNAPSENCFIPQYLKLEKENVEIQEHLMHARIALINFSVETLRINENSLPILRSATSFPFSVESQGRTGEGDNMSNESESTKKDILDVGTRSDAESHACFPEIDLRLATISGKLLTERETEKNSSELKFDIIELTTSKTPCTFIPVHDSKKEAIFLSESHSITEIAPLELTNADNPVSLASSLIVEESSMIQSKKSKTGFDAVTSNKGIGLNDDIPSEDPQLPKNTVAMEPAEQHQTISLTSFELLIDPSLEMTSDPLCDDAREFLEEVSLGTYSSRAASGDIISHKEDEISTKGHSHETSVCLSSINGRDHVDDFQVPFLDISIIEKRNNHEASVSNEKSIKQCMISEARDDCCQIKENSEMFVDDEKLWIDSKSEVKSVQLHTTNHSANSNNLLCGNMNKETDVIVESMSEFSKAEVETTRDCCAQVTLKETDNVGGEHISSADDKSSIPTHLKCDICVDGKDENIENSSKHLLNEKISQHTPQYKEMIMEKTQQTDTTSKNAALSCTDANYVYQQMFLKIPLPEDEFLTSDSEEVTIFRTGFELCHRTLLSICDIDNAIFQYTTGTRNQSSSSCHDVTTGLTNLKPWNDCTVADKTDVTNESPEVKSKVIESNDVRPLILVPLIVAYSSWAFMLGLYHSDEDSVTRNDGSASHAGTMYSWIVSNQPHLSSLDVVGSMNSSFQLDVNLNEVTILVCNFVCNVLRSNGLIHLYGADVKGYENAVSSELSFFLGVDQYLFEEAVKDVKSIMLENSLVDECHKIIADLMFPRVREILEPRASSPTKIILWYFFQNIIRHLIRSKRLEDAKWLLMCDTFIRARLENMGYIPGVAAHSRDCSNCLFHALKELKFSTLHSVDGASGEKKEQKQSTKLDLEFKTMSSLDEKILRDSFVQTLCFVSKILREQVEKLSSDSNVRRVKEEIGSSFQILGTTIRDLGENRKEEVEQYQEALRLKSEVFGEKGSESVAEILYAIGCYHQRCLNLVSAQECYQKALNIYKASLGPHNIAVASVLHNIGIIHVASDKPDIAMKCFKKSLMIRKSLLGEDDICVADSLCWIGNIHREKREYVEARECFIFAHRTKATILGNNHAECSDILHNLGIVYEDLKKFEESLSCYKKAMLIRRSKLTCSFNLHGTDDLCESLNRIANLYKVRGEHQKSLQFFEQSLRRRVRLLSGAKLDKEQVLKLLLTYDEVIALLKLKLNDSIDKSEDTAKIGSLLLEMGKLYEHNLFKPMKALLYFQEALKMLKQTKNYEQIGDVLSLMGTIYVNTSSNEKALTCFSEALSMKKRSSMFQSIGTAELLHNIGNCLAKNGELKESLHRYKESLIMKKEILCKTHISVAKTEHCIGLVLLQLSNFHEALEYFQSSMKTRESVLGLEHLDVAFSLHNIGKVYFHLEKIDESIACIEKALKLKKLHLIDTHVSIAETEHILASLQIKKGRFDVALSLLKSALSTYKGTRVCELLISDVLDLLGEVYFKTGEVKRAMSTFEQSLKLKRANLSHNHIACANVLMKIGELKAVMNDLNGALIIFKEVKRIHKISYGANHLKNADLLIQVGIVQQRLENNDMALGCFMEALRIRQLLLDKRDTSISEALTHVGRAHQERNDHACAMTYFWDAIDIYAETDSINAKASARVKHLLGVSKISSGEFVEALSLLEESLHVYASNGDDESDEWIVIAYDLGMAKMKLGLNDAAADILEKCVLLKKKSGTVDSCLSNALFQLGNIYSRNDPDKAFTVLDEALTIRKSKDNNELEISEVLFKIGLLHESKKKYLESISCYEESLYLRQSKLGDDEVSADILFRMGELFRLCQKLKSALEKLFMALEIYEHMVGEKYNSIAKTLHSIGYIYEAKNDMNKAMKYHNQGLDLRKLHLGQDHVQVAASLDDVAGLHQKLGNNEKALCCLKEALKIRRQHLDCGNMDIATTLFAMGIILTSLNDNEGAIECYTSSLDISSCNGSNPKLEAQTLHQIGCVHADKCLYRDALQKWRTSLSKYREAGLSDDHYMVACTLGNIEMAENVLAGL